ncbi:MAG TPA: YiiX/YebB-like N1pC/P60 family cysteine hydrolase [Chitinophagaceae bacterium]|jgi:hypothetical protein|nr:YiiX/YebB-like N1pC/P60 family cysteine hydrolase [Chitinophagaceae bacterium]HMU57375.1 YiiX/YebB-like N1pC/P60 family cysteine hydrolase [Chitinophagaceae bacterium]
MKRIFLLVLSLFFIAYACNDKKEKPAKTNNGGNTISNAARIGNLKKLVQSGDLIFRNGNDEVSRAARSFNRKDTSYSHCGIIFIENDSPFVYHALGGTYNPSQKLMRQPIEAFADPAENNSIGIYRYHLTGKEMIKLAEVVHDYHRSGLKFDLFFNFQSDNVMYCSEFVFKSLNKAVDGRYTSYIRTDTMPYGVTTDDLYLNPDSKLVKREVFQY